MIVLREDQIGPVNEVRDAFRAGKRAVLLQGPTGWGKGIILTHMAQGSIQRNRRSVFIAHRRELIEDLHQRITGNGVPAGIIMSGHPETHHSIQVASVQSLAPKARRYHFDNLYVDEAHHATIGSMYDKLREAYPNALIVGSSATPCRLDGKGLGVGHGGFFDHMVHGPTPKWLIERGLLANWIGFEGHIKVDASHARTTAGDYNSADLEELYDKPKIIGDIIANYRLHAMGERGVCWCATVQHAQNVARDFNAAGIPAMAVWGTMDPDQRARAFNGLRDGRIWLLTFCNLIDEGVNIPEISVVISARKTKSITKWRQVMGRGMRPKAGGKRLTILDHSGNLNDLGGPCEDIEWSLEGKPKKARAKLAAMVRCPVCFADQPPALVCCDCGASLAKEMKAREAQEAVDGVMVKVTPEELEARRKAKRRDIGRGLGMAKTMADLWEIAQKHDYKPGWVYHQARIRGINS